MNFSTVYSPSSQGFKNLLGAALVFASVHATQIELTRPDAHYIFDKKQWLRRQRRAAQERHEKSLRQLEEFRPIEDLDVQSLKKLSSKSLCLYLLDAVITQVELKYIWKTKTPGEVIELQSLRAATESAPYLEELFLCRVLSQAKTYGVKKNDVATQIRLSHPQLPSRASPSSIPKILAYLDALVSKLFNPQCPLSQEEQIKSHALIVQGYKEYLSEGGLLKDITLTRLHKIGEKVCLSDRDIEDAMRPSSLFLKHEYVHHAQQPRSRPPSFGSPANGPL